LSYIPLSRPPISAYAAATGHQGSKAESQGSFKPGISLDSARGAEVGRTGRLAP